MIAILLETCMAMATNAGCALNFVTNSLLLSRVIDIFESLPEVGINHAPVNARGGEVYVIKPDCPKQKGLKACS